jgi:hypothetical protein
LIEKGGAFSSAALEEELNEIRRNFTPSLGKDHGRVVRKKAKPLLEERLTEFRAKLEKHQKKVEMELQGKLDASRVQIVEYYLPSVLDNPPDMLLAQCGDSNGDVTESDARSWLSRQLKQVFPEAGALTGKMRLDVRYKDMTFETLNEKDFLEAVGKAFPDTDWNKAYDEFKAAGEKEK